eukprot:IDg13060t1
MPHSHRMEVKGSRLPSAAIAMPAQLSPRSSLSPQMGLSLAMELSSIASAVTSSPDSDDYADKPARLRRARRKGRQPRAKQTPSYVALALPQHCFALANSGGLTPSHGAPNATRVPQAKAPVPLSVLSANSTKLDQSAVHFFLEIPGVPYMAYKVFSSKGPQGIVWIPQCDPIPVQKYWLATMNMYLPDDLARVVFLNEKRPI